MYINEFLFTKQELVECSSDQIVDGHRNGLVRVHKCLLKNGLHDKTIALLPSHMFTSNVNGVTFKIDLNIAANDLSIVL